MVFGDGVDLDIRFVEGRHFLSDLSQLVDISLDTVDASYFC